MRANSEHMPAAVNWLSRSHFSAIRESRFRRRLLEDVPDMFSAHRKGSSARTCSPCRMIPLAAAGRPIRAQHGVGLADIAYQNVAAWQSQSDWPVKFCHGACILPRVNRLTARPHGGSPRPCRRMLEFERFSGPQEPSGVRAVWVVMRHVPIAAALGLSAVTGDWLVGLIPVLPSASSTRLRPRKRQCAASKWWL